MNFSEDTYSFDPSKVAHKIKSNVLETKEIQMEYVIKSYSRERNESASQSVLFIQNYSFSLIAHWIRQIYAIVQVF